MSHPTSMTYTGRVIDQRRQAPISGARVYLKLEDTTVFSYTDIEGIYQLLIYSGYYAIQQGELSVTAKGYINYKSSIKLSLQKKELGDIRLTELNTDINSSYLFPVLIGATIVLLIMTMIILNSTQKKIPENPRNRYSVYIVKM